MDERYEKELARLFDKLDSLKPGTTEYHDVENSIDKLRARYIDERKQQTDEKTKKRELDIKEAQARQQADIEQQKLELEREKVIIDAANAKKEHKRKWWEILLPFLGALGLYGFSIYVDQHSDSLLPKWAADITRKHGFRK